MKGRIAQASYYSKTQAIILVVDSTDRARLGLVRDELARMINDDVRFPSTPPFIPQFLR